jgi:outer membrane protein OmpA-like peptidoglycan-associated protein
MPDTAKHRTLRLVLILGSFLLLIPAMGHAQEFEAELRATRVRLEEARIDGLDVISPRNFQRAQERLADAAQRYERGDRIDSVRQRLTEAQDALAEAERFLGVGSRLFGEALTARMDALAMEAPDRAPNLWERAEAVIIEAGQRLERGDEEGASARVSEAETLFRDAELEAIRSDVLGRARDARDAAMVAGTRELAPAKFGQADGYFEEANRVLDGDRSQRGDAAGLGEAAAAAFARAAYVGSLSDSVARRRVLLEVIFERHETEVGRISEQLGYDADFFGGIEPVADQAVAAIASLQEDRRNLESQLARSEAENRMLGASVDSLEIRLAGLEEREAEVSAQLRERERRDQKLREVSAIFNEEEGRVVVSGDQLILRLYGLSFASGSDQIRPAHYALLTKVQRVLRDFPEAPVSIEGHTDSQGNDELNRALSRRRAFAVREYLLANMPISSDRLTAIGYGEDRPVASNETADGRERNRRIDVVLDISDS